MSPYPLEQINDGSTADHNFRRLAQDMNPPVPQVRVFNSAAQTLVNGTTTVLTFDSERYDSGSLHSTSLNTGRLTAPITGLYRVTGHVGFALNATGRRRGLLRLNGVTFIGIQDAYPTAADAAYLTVTTDWEMVAGDYVEFLAEQTSGGNLNTVAGAAFSPEFSMHRVAGFVNAGV